MSIVASGSPSVTAGGSSTNWNTPPPRVADDAHEGVDLAPRGEA